jgi:hypothetical protein
MRIAVGRPLLRFFACSYPLNTELRFTWNAFLPFWNPCLRRNASRHYSIPVSTAYTWLSPCIFDLNTTHFLSGVKWAFGSRL